MTIADSLVSRITAILLAGAAVILGIVALAVAWPSGGEGARLFRMPRAAEAATIVRAVEAGRGEARALVVEALDTSVTRVAVRADFPPQPPRTRPATPDDPGFTAYAEALEGRAFRIDLLRGDTARRWARGRDAVQLSVRMADGTVTVIQRRPPQVIRGSIAQAAAVWAAVSVVLLVMLLLAIRQTARPVAALAVAVRSFGDDLDTPDLPQRGPRELRALSEAFNTMKQRIRDLVLGRTRMLAAIAHDMRTYLTRLRLRVELISDPDQRLKAVHDLEELTALLDDTLLFARRDDRPEPAGPLDVRVELRRLAELRVEMGGAVTLLDGPSPQARIPVLALRRIVSNLLDNALRYGEQATISLEAGPGQARIIVRDAGPGVPETDLARLLEPFERGEESRNRNTGGAGLGLSIVKALAEAHGGMLGLRNTPQGLEAVVTLPGG